MTDPIVFGFPRSTFVQIVRLILTHKVIPYTWDSSRKWKTTHLGLHPSTVFDLQHGDFGRRNERDRNIPRRYLQRAGAPPKGNPRARPCISGSARSTRTTTPT
jgi:hypothetical protein